jgi:anti-sigma factor RsiW
MTDDRNRQTSAGMTCQELVELITEYLEGTLAPSERMRFEAHVRTCSACAAYIEQMRVTIRLLGNLSVDSMSDMARKELLATFRTWKASSAEPGG